MENLKSFPWYDSQWHSARVRARKWLQSRSQEEVQAFDLMLESFQTPRQFQPIVLKSLLSASELELYGQEARKIKKEDFIQNEKSYFGRDLLRHHSFFSEMQKELLPMMEEKVGEALEVSYNFLSLYGGDAICPIHMDSVEAKWTLDICFEQSRPWPLYFSEIQDWPNEFESFNEGWEERLKKSVSFKKVLLEPGDAVIFSGSSQWHYRDQIMSSEDYCRLIFFHYLPKGMALYRHPKIWAMHMGIPELESVAGGRS
jgi:hypothetical protein